MFVDCFYQILCASHASANTLLSINLKYCFVLNLNQKPRSSYNSAIFVFATSWKNSSSISFLIDRKRKSMLKKTIQMLKNVVQGFRIYTEVLLFLLFNES